jgi:predicted CoA-substrate-specific enzyme activase
MTITAGIDVGSTYTKCVLVRDGGEVIGCEVAPTGFKLTEISAKTFAKCVADSKLREKDVSYVVATGIGRHQVDFKDIHVTDLTAAARGSRALFPGTRTVLDVGGQTMKASRLDESAKVVSFRLNDKCAAGTGAFLEKTARYMGFGINEIGPLLTTSKEPVPISGVCAVFAESEVINHLSLGTAPADIMQGAVESLVGRSAQLVRRVKAQPEFTLIGGILRFDTFAEAVRKQLESDVNVPDPGMVQFVSAYGAALLGQRRLEMLAGDEGSVATTREGTA